MLHRFPGTTVEVVTLEKGSSRQLFDGLFAAGGITLSQVSVMTGLEPYLIQNWVKRGFVSPPLHRMYSREQFARIVLINMLREALQLERICALIRLIGKDPANPADDLIGDEELYHRYVDMVAQVPPNMSDRESVLRAAKLATADFEERSPVEKRQLTRILQVMLYAHASAYWRHSAEEILFTLQ